MTKDRTEALIIYPLYKNETEFEIRCVNKGKKILPVSGLGIQVSPHCTRSKTSGIPSRQEAV